MVEVDITKQCKARLEFSWKGEALVYLYRMIKIKGKMNEEKIVLLDSHGFHFMVGADEQYRIEDGYKARAEITWFKVYKK